MPHETLFRVIVEVVLSIADGVLTATTTDHWRIWLSIILAVTVGLIIWITLDPGWLRITLTFLAAVGIPIQGIRWHMRSGD